MLDNKASFTKTYSSVFLSTYATKIELETYREITTSILTSQMSLTLTVDQGHKNLLPIVNSTELLS